MGVYIFKFTNCLKRLLEYNVSQLLKQYVVNWFGIKDYYGLIISNDIVKEFLETPNNMINNSVFGSYCISMNIILTNNRTSHDFRFLAKSFDIEIRVDMIAKSSYF